MNNLRPIKNLYLFHFSLFFALFFSACLAFYMQFKYDGLQEQILLDKNEVAEYQDKIRLLEIEWVYLTRPERLRQLTEKFLQDNQYMLASQVQENIVESTSTELIIKEQKSVLQKL